MKYVPLLAIIISIFLSTNTQANQYTKTYDICSPYQSGPFIIDERKRSGLVYTFADYLNAQAAGQFRFNVIVLPRIRLVGMLEANANCIVPFVSALWFQPSPEHYDWTKPITYDANVILSSSQLKLESLAPAVINGMSTSVVSGFTVEQPLETLIQNKQLTLFTTANIEHGVGMVAKERIDFIVTGRMILEYVRANLNVQSSTYLSRYQTLAFERALIVPKVSPELTQFIHQQTEQFGHSKQWIDALALLGISNGNNQ
ncbi:hypothetical protein [Colwellia sp. MEBiC06753]